jgi:hypothetical protein
MDGTVSFAHDHLVLLIITIIILGDLLENGRLFQTGLARLFNIDMLLILARQILLASYQCTPQNFLLASATV